MGATMVRRRVLIADDEDDVRCLLRMWVPKRTSAEVVGEAADGQEALDLWHELRPDVVVLDDGMPGLTGGEVARRIKDADPTVRIVVFTGRHLDGLRDLKRDHPDVELVRKPDLEALGGLVETLFD